MSKRSKAQIKEVMDGLRATYQNLMETTDLPDVDEVQQQAEESLQKVLNDIEHKRKMTKDSLQGAFILGSVDQGEVLAVVGDRFPRQAGFNRVLDMKRPVGSVIKPAGTVQSAHPP